LKRTSFLRAVLPGATLSLPLLFLFVFPLALRADDRPALTLPEVLARYRLAVPSVSRRTVVVARRLAGTTDYGGLHGTWAAVFKHPDKTWEEDKIGLLDEVSGSNGKVSWHQDTNGNVRLESEEEQKDDKTSAAVSSSLFADPAGFRGKVSIRPQTEHKTGCYVLDVAPEGGKPTTLFLDPKTFQVVKEQRMEDDRMMTITFSDFRGPAGGQIATTTRVSIGDRKFDRVTKVSSVQDDNNVPDALFAPPVAPNNYQWTTPGATSASLPFDYSDKSISLYSAVNGQPTFMQLDSGAGGVAISSLAAYDMKLMPVGTFEGRGYGGSLDEHLIKINSFEIVGGVVFSDFTATSEPMFGINLFLQSVPKIGLLGYDLLSRFVVRINYEAQTLTLIDPKTFQPSAGDGVSLPLDLNNNVPSVLASFDSLPPAHFLVDTGDGASTVMLYSPYVAENHVAQKYPQGIYDVGQGVGNVFLERQVRAHSFAIAGEAFHDIPTHLSLDTKGAGAGRLLAGALGTDFLSRFTVTFDYPHSRIFFAPNSQTHKPFDTRTFGIMVVQGVDYKSHKPRMVIGANPKAPDKDVKKLYGATLLQIDGQDALALGLGEVRRRLSPDDGKDTHDLLIADDKGRQSHVTVGMYDPLPPSAAK